MKEYTQENLINHLSLSKENDVLFLLGAGCSINSGCMAAGKMINEFKRRIYCARHGLILNDNSLVNDKAFLQNVDDELPSNMENPYSFYFEQCFPTKEDRSKFVKEKYQNISPSYGYLCFANYLINNHIKTLLTTNFDNLIEKAIRKIDDNYDITFESDDITPRLSPNINIIKLHGDYNYDCLRNTEEELQSLSDKIYNIVTRLNSKEIIVIGYSGMDRSVMSALELMSNNGVKIIWCSISKYHHANERIESLFTGNDDSGYCFIDSFDELFAKLYNFQGNEIELINALFSKAKYENFKLDITNQPEQLSFNANELINSPLCYKTKASYDMDFIKRFNNDNKFSFLMQYKDKLYFVGDVEIVKEKLQIDKNDIETTLICEERIPVDKKCKFIKELLKTALKIKGLEIYKDNVFFKNNERIKEGLELTVDLFNGKLCLLTNVNYFSLLSSENDNIKYLINKQKSNLYASKNFEKRNILLDQIFGQELKFKAFNSIAEFNKTNLDSISPNSEIYNCSEEPEMIVDKNCSVNQIMLLNKFGPRTTLFSNETIKVGVFCAKDDKQKLNNYLSLLCNGTQLKQNFGSVIPKYKGFREIFKKQIEIEYEGLPDFNTTFLVNSEKIDFMAFKEFCLRGIKKLYDEKGVDIVLIYISNKLSKFKTQDDLDLHDIIKLACANKYKTQFLEEKTIDSQDDLNKKILNLAIGIYTKTIGMSWYPKNYSKDTLFLGMSFGRDSKGITVGCSQMFDGAGRGMQLIIS